MYEDKLDGTITSAFYAEKATAWRAEQARLQARIADLQASDENAQADDAIHMITLAQEAAKLFPTQPPEEKRALLTLLIENATWKDARLTVEFRPSFDSLQRLSNPPTPTGRNGLDEKRAGNEIWRATRDAIRTAMLERKDFRPRLGAFEIRP